jgi:HSP20 family protein
MWLTGWSDFDREFAALDELRRRMDRAFQDLDGGRGTVGDRVGFGVHAWPRTNLYDHGNELVLRAEVPGMSQKDLQISATQDVLTLSGERRTEAPEGYSVHRQERGQVRFSRSFTLPCKVDVEKTSAAVKNGLLTVTLAKAAEAQPRQITVKAQS